MKIEKKILEKSVVEFIVEEKKEKVAKFRKKALEYLRNNADIKGFRKGSNIPDDILIRNYGEEHINQMTIESAIDSMYREALKKEKLFPVAEAEIKEIISQDPLIIRIHIEVFPEIIVDPKYKKVKLRKQKVTVTAKEVDAALSDIQTRFTKFEEVTDKKSNIKMGDKVIIDTDGYDLEGKILETTSMKDYPVVLGSDMLVPGFEEQLVGAKLGDTPELDIEFPKDYHNSSFAGKKTKFKVNIKKLEKAVKPEFTPEFIKQLRGKELDLAGFKNLVKEEIKDTKEANVRMEEESKLIEELLKVTKLDIGVKMLSNQIDKVYAEIKENISKDGMKVANYLESLKLSEEEYKEKQVKPIALKRLQGELILHKIMELDKISVSDKELASEVEKILAKFDSEDVLKRLKELYVPGNKYYEELRQRMSYRKLIDTFFE